MQDRTYFDIFSLPQHLNIDLVALEKSFYAFSRKLHPDRFAGRSAAEQEAALALGGLLVNPEYASVTGRYFDGFREIPSSVESRDTAKARSVWEQGALLAGLTRQEVNAGIE